MGDLTANFSLREFRCRDGTDVPLMYFENVRSLAVQLQILRNELGVPITIISGYRTPEHNQRKNGAAMSRHLTAEAADIRAANTLPATVHAVLLRLIHAGRMRDGGVSQYPTWVHYDIGRPRRW